MEIFDKISDTIINVGKDVTQKAKDVSGIAKLKMDIRSKEDFIKEQYIELGKLYYEKYKGSEEEEQAQFERIDEAMNEIEQMKLQILEIRKAKKCPDCGAEAPDTAGYCSVCGAKLSIVEDMPDTETEEESKKDDDIDF